MSNRDAKLLARIWADDPSLLAEDLSGLIAWLKSCALYEKPGGSGKKDAPGIHPGSLLVKLDAADEALQRTLPSVRGLHEYRRMIPKTQIQISLLQPLVDAFTAAADGQTDVAVEGFQTIEQAVASISRWAQSQAQKTAVTTQRSDLLKTTIEELGEEILVVTDENGSVKLRGTSNIPMFLAFWRAPKHRLGPDAFLDIDRSVRKTNLERHRTRLCALLQRVLLEIVADGNALKLQNCRE